MTDKVQIIPQQIRQIQKNKLILKINKIIICLLLFLYGCINDSNNRTPLVLIIDTKNHLLLNNFDTGLKINHNRICYYNFFYRVKDGFVFITSSISDSLNNKNIINVKYFLTKYSFNKNEFNDIANINVFLNKQSTKGYPSYEMINITFSKMTSQYEKMLIRLMISKIFNEDYLWAYQGWIVNNCIDFSKYTFVKAIYPVNILYLNSCNIFKEIVLSKKVDEVIYNTDISNNGNFIIINSVIHRLSNIQSKHAQYYIYLYNNLGKKIMEFSSLNCEMSRVSNDGKSFLLMKQANKKEIPNSNSKVVYDIFLKTGNNNERYIGTGINCYFVE